MLGHKKERLREKLVNFIKTDVLYGYDDDYDDFDCEPIRFRFRKQDPADMEIENSEPNTSYSRCEESEEALRSYGRKAGDCNVTLHRRGAGEGHTPVPPHLREAAHGHMPPHEMGERWEHEGPHGRGPGAGHGHIPPHLRGAGHGHVPPYEMGERWEHEGPHGRGPGAGHGHVPPHLRGAGHAPVPPHARGAHKSPHERMQLSTLYLDEDELEVLYEIYGDDDSVDAVVEYIYTAPPEILVEAKQLIKLIRTVKVSDYNSDIIGSTDEAEAESSVSEADCDLENQSCMNEMNSMSEAECAYANDCIDAGEAENAVPDKSCGLEKDAVSNAENTDIEGSASKSAPEAALDSAERTDNQDCSMLDKSIDSLIESILYENGDNECCRNKKKLQSAKHVKPSCRRDGINDRLSRWEVTMIPDAEQIYSDIYDYESAEYIYLLKDAHYEAAVISNLIAYLNTLIK